MTTDRTIAELVARAATLPSSEFATAFAALSDDQLSALADQLEEALQAKSAEGPRRLLTLRQPHDDTAWYQLGFNLYYLQHEHEAAEVVFSEAQRHCPDDLDLMIARAINLTWGLKRFPAALACLSEVLARDPRHPQGREVYAWSLLCSGDIDAGLPRIRALLREREVEGSLAPSSALEFHTYLYLFGEADERARALQDAARLLRAGVREPMAEVFDLVRIAEERGHPEASRLKRFCEVVLDRAPLAALLDWPAFSGIATPPPKAPDPPREPSPSPGFHFPEGILQAAELGGAREAAAWLRALTREAVEALGYDDVPSLLLRDGVPTFALLVGWPPSVHRDQVVDQVLARLDESQGDFTTYRFSHASSWVDLVSIDAGTANPRGAEQAFAAAYRHAVNLAPVVGGMPYSFEMTPQSWTESGRGDRYYHPGQHVPGGCNRPPHYPLESILAAGAAGVVLPNDRIPDLIEAATKSGCRASVMGPLEASPARIISWDGHGYGTTYSILETAGGDFRIICEAIH